jgi:hypothetical protein
MSTSIFKFVQSKVQMEMYKMGLTLSKNWRNSEWKNYAQFAALVSDSKFNTVYSCNFLGEKEINIYN